MRPYKTTENPPNPLRGGAGYAILKPGTFRSNDTKEAEEVHNKGEDILYKITNAIPQVIKVGLIGYAVLCALFIFFWILAYPREPAPVVPPPEITYGEFPVELVYEIDGEIVTVSDIYVCEYEGYRHRRHEWKAYMKRTGELGFVLHKDLFTKIYCRIGYADYYMGENVEAPGMEAVVIYKDFSGSGVLFPAELYEKHKIKLISWTMPEPIENSFPDGYTQ